MRHLNEHSAVVVRKCLALFTRSFIKILLGYGGRKVILQIIVSFFNNTVKLLNRRLFTVQNVLICAP